MIGALAFIAMSWILTIFCAWVSDSDPPNTVKSLAKTNVLRPLTVPQPVTTPSPGTLDFSMPNSTERCSTNMSNSSNEPLSSSSSMRSRAVSLPRACCASIRFSPPPSFAPARRSSRVSSMSFMGCFPLVCPGSSMAVRARETRRLTVRWRLGLLPAKPAITKQEDRMHLATLAGMAAALLCGAALLSGSPTLAQANPKEIAARVELHAFPSLTLSDQQFLSGDAGGKQVTMTGEFRIAQGTGRLPVVILMHGSGGIGANIEPWTRTFNAMGVSTFTIDGFSGRGLTSVNTDQASLGRLNFILDIYGALGLLAKHPRVDPDRIVLMGFSRGGQAALYASLNRFHKIWNKSGAQFAAYIPFYPDCATSYASETEIADKPIRIFHGIPDDYNPVASCKPYIQRLRDAGRDVLL